LVLFIDKVKIVIAARIGGKKDFVPNIVQGKNC